MSALAEALGALVSHSPRLDCLDIRGCRLEDAARLRFFRSVGTQCGQPSRAEGVVYSTNISRLLCSCDGIGAACAASILEAVRLNDSLSSLSFGLWDSTEAAYHILREAEQLVTNRSHRAPVCHPTIHPWHVEAEEQFECVVCCRTYCMNVLGHSCAEGDASRLMCRACFQLDQYGHGCRAPPRCTPHDLDSAPLSYSMSESEGDSDSDSAATGERAIDVRRRREAAMPCSFCIVGVTRCLVDGCPNFCCSRCLHHSQRGFDFALDQGTCCQSCHAFACEEHHFDSESFDFDEPDPAYRGMCTCAHCEIRLCCACAYSGDQGAGWEWRKGKLRLLLCKDCFEEEKT